MTTSAAVNELQPRDRSLSILKAIAIIFVVIAHSGGPSWLVNSAYMFCVPVFFLCTGYLFKSSYLKDARTYLWRRVRWVYFPFWGWSILFLVLHNFFFFIGILNEQHGNMSGGVLHPYSWHNFWQRVWSVTFNMSGYDEFLCGAFWFFRTMFVSSIVFLGLFLLIRKITHWRNKSAVVLFIVGLVWMLALWQVGGDLKITGLAQGGYRELMAIVFIGVGYLYRRHERYMGPTWISAAGGLVVFLLFACWSPSAMVVDANYAQFFSLPLPAVGIFFTLLYLSRKLSDRCNVVSNSLAYIGERTLYVFAFHLLAFKLVSIIKVLTYGLDWSYVGGHTVVNVYKDDYFFLLYVLVGVGLPLLCKYIWMKMDEKYNLTWINCLIYICRGLKVAILFLYHIVIRLCKAVWRSLVNFKRDMGDFWKASNFKEEE